ncbi:hypothetical protein [Acinetobacter schindleri]
MLREETKQVVNGRRLATRRIVMNTLATVTAQVWRKEVVYTTDGNNPKSKLSFEALQTSQQDEPNYKYNHVGYASVLFDKFNGGYMSKNNAVNNPVEASLMAQIEPFDMTLPTIDDQIFKVPKWVIKEGDILGLMLYGEHVVWVEVVNLNGQTVMPDFGIKYTLNRRDDLMIEPIRGEA